MSLITTAAKVAFFPVTTATRAATFPVRTGYRAARALARRRPNTRDMVRMLPYYSAIHVSEDLASITSFNPDEEVKPQEVGMTEAGVRAIWEGIEDMYRTGMHPGISFCLRRNGRIVLKRAIGHARGNGPDDPPDAPKELITPETPACLFSASKAITAMLIHLLAEQGQIGLLDPVCEYVPEFGRHGKDKTSIYHILCHKSGFPMLPEDVDRELLFDHDECVRYLCDMKPAYAPGHVVAYHAVTSGFLLQEIAHRAVGKSVRELIDEYVREPLGLKYFNYGMSREHVGDVAKNYYTGLPLVPPLSTIARRALTVPWNEVIDISNDPRFFTTIIPSANVYATADETSVFFQMLKNGGTYNGIRVLDPLTIRRATMEANRMTLDRVLMLPMRYSAGMMLGANPVGIYGPYTHKAFGHWGFINSLVWADPARDTSVCMLATGKPLLGPHLPAMAKILTRISWYCRREDD
ncbi:MAG: serine hydrolase domain-containing protein [Desulfatibacillaceae bacterium]